MDRRRRKGKRAKARQHTTRPRPRRVCIVCLTNDGPFGSREHIVSEALGNKTLLLPPGVVCDPCNNERLSHLDQALLAFPPIQLVRVLRGLPSKAGSWPVAKFSNGTITYNGDANLVVKSDSNRFMQETGPNELTINVEMANLTGRKLQLVSRALLKMALECAYKDVGYYKVIGKRWDPLRAAVLDRNHRGYVVLPKRPELDEGTGTVSVSYLPSPDGEDPFKLAVRLEAFGLGMGTVLGHELPAAVVRNAIGVEIGHVLPFPKPARTPKLTLKIGVEFAKRTTFDPNSGELPDFVRG